MSGRAKLFAAGAALAALAGCGLVVGSGDYSVGNVTLGSEGGANPDDAGSSADGHVVSGQDATSPGDSGGGEGGLSVPDSGGAGHCGSSIPTTTADFRKLVNTCVQAVNCDESQFPVNVSDCITQNYLQATGSVACLSTISDCNGFYSCQGDRIAQPSECSSTDMSGACNGNVATYCFGGSYLGAVKNCDKLGGTCGTYTDDSGNPAAGCQVVPTCTEDDLRQRLPLLGQQALHVQGRRRLRQGLHRDQRHVSRSRWRQRVVRLQLDGVLGRRIDVQQR